MEINFFKATKAIKMALLEANNKAFKRRLNVLDESVPCKSGCHGCCHRLVQISIAEAVILYEHLLEKKKWIAVKKESELQSSAIRDSNSLSWFKMRNPCPILDPESKKCEAYSVRPVACSTHFVTSDPELCDPWGLNGGEYKPVDMSDIKDWFYDMLKRNSDEFGIMNCRLPIPIALLLAERISVRSGLDLNEVISMTFNELSRKYE